MAVLHPVDWRYLSLTAITGPRGGPGADFTAKGSAEAEATSVRRE
jgi:hypothetical protein